MIGIRVFAPAAVAWVLFFWPVLALGQGSHHGQGHSQRHFHDSFRHRPPHGHLHGLGHAWHGVWGYPYGSTYLSYGYYDPYGISYSPWSGHLHYSLSPVYVPAELLYGPQPIKQFMGVGRDFGLGPLLKPAPAVAAPEPAREESLPKVRESNLETRVLAARFVANGDASFAEQRFLEALERYKTASRIAPDVATTYFRRAWAHIALGDYARAAEEFRRGLELDAAFARSTFRLETLYRDNVLAKAAHLESLAHAALLRPDDAELLFLLGLFLHFDDQPARAERFFARAVELAGGEGGHARLFLKPVDGKPAASRPAEGAAPRMPAGVDI